MAKTSAGLLLYRRRADVTQVLLVHPGGPFWRNKDAGAWTIPKGERRSPVRTALAAARREFAEELGIGRPATARSCRCPPVRQKGGKTVLAWALAGDLDADAVRSNTFQMEWPPRSGKTATFPEVDRAAWFDLATAGTKLNPAGAVWLSAVVDRLADGSLTIR